ncbi:FAD-dependent monooxygenase [Halothiobacillus sp. DCM-1]|uniref:FAD-dependent monooxygenase n=1 Tax=Halothiobacillus sp. DCM-1 TaxID=3112558 RepID=UPI003245A36F
MITSAPSTDILIVGGGMVGGVLAHALVQAGWRVTVLEGAAPGESPSFDARLTALSEASWRYLDALGLVDASTAAHAQAIEEVRVVDAGHFGMTRITRANNHGVALGEVIANRQIEQALIQARRALPPGALDWRQPARYLGHALAADGQSVCVRFLQDGIEQQQSTRLLVAADGAHSPVRAQTGATVQHQPYGQTAIVCTARPERPHQGTGFECFTRGGPLAVLPAPAGRVSLVWVNRDEDIPALMALSDEAYAARLNQLFRARLGRLTELTARSAYPLNLVTVQELTAPRLVILGNAAHALHPVAGQGFNLCLRDVRDLVDSLRADRGVPVDPGAAERLSHYTALRAADYRRTIGLTDRLVKGFSLDLPGAGLLRGALLSALDGVRPIKNRLVRLTRGI